MRSPFLKLLSTSLLLLILNWGLSSCGDRIRATTLTPPESSRFPVVSGQLAEVAPPPLLAQLNQSLEHYNPQITVLSPRQDQVIQDRTVEVKLEVQDLPIFKDPDLEMGPHLHLILDNKTYQSIYDISQPLRLENLTPGTHTLRVLAVRPWGESFKNDGAYAQTTFHVFSKNGANSPSASLPLLTYNIPQGQYGSEPILLDFHLSNAPLHIIAQEDPQDEIPDWRIRVTINGESFLLDRWQPLYLKGFKPGENWVQLEFIDDAGNEVDNVFNNTVRAITYTPKEEDTLSRLMRGDLSLEVARALVDPDYKAKLTPPTPEVETPPTEAVETSSPEVETPPTEAVETSSPELETSAPALETSSPEMETPAPALETLPEVVETPTPEVETSSPELENFPETKVETSTPEVETSSPAVETQSPQRPQWLKSLGDRFEQWKTRFSAPQPTAPEPEPKTIPLAPEPVQTPVPVVPEVELPETIPEAVTGTSPITSPLTPEVELPAEPPLEPEPFIEPSKPVKPAIPKFILRNYQIFGNNTII